MRTYATNVLGTVHLLEAACGCTPRCVVVIITSDKCYENQEWAWGYRENDRWAATIPIATARAARSS